MVGESHLVFIQLAVLVFLLSLVLEGDNNETDEYVYHKKGNYDYVYYVVYRNDWTVVVDGTVVFLIRIDRDVEQSEAKDNSLQKIKNKNIKKLKPRSRL